MPLLKNRLIYLSLYYNVNEILLLNNTPSIPFPKVFSDWFLSVVGLFFSANLNISAPACLIQDWNLLKTFLVTLAFAAILVAFSFCFGKRVAIGTTTPFLLRQVMQQSMRVFAYTTNPDDGVKYLSYAPTMPWLYNNPLHALVFTLGFAACLVCGWWWLQEMFITGFGVWPQGTAIMDAIMRGALNHDGRKKEVPPHFDNPGSLDIPSFSLSRSWRAHLQKNDAETERSSDFLTPLMVAVIRGWGKMVKKLLDEAEAESPRARRALLDAQTSTGMTALMFACIAGSHDIVFILLGCTYTEGCILYESQLQPDLQIKTDDIGMTALMWAALKGHASIVKLLQGASYEVEKTRPTLAKLLSKFQASLFDLLWRFLRTLPQNSFLLMLSLLSLPYYFCTLCYNWGTYCHTYCSRQEAPTPGVSATPSPTPIIFSSSPLYQMESLQKERKDFVELCVTLMSCISQNLKTFLSRYIYERGTLDFECNALDFALMRRNDAQHSQQVLQYNCGSCKPHVDYEATVRRLTPTPLNSAASSKEPSCWQQLRHPLSTSKLPESKIVYPSQFVPLALTDAADVCMPPAQESPDNWDILDNTASFFITRLDLFQGTTRQIAAFAILFGPFGGFGAAVLKTTLSLFDIVAFIVLYCCSEHKVPLLDRLCFSGGMLVALFTNGAGLYCSLQGKDASCANNLELGAALIVLNLAVQVAVLLLFCRMICECRFMCKQWRQGLGDEVEVPRPPLDWRLRPEYHHQAHHKHLSTRECSLECKAAGSSGGSGGGNGIGGISSSQTGAGKNLEHPPFPGDSRLEMRAPEAVSPPIMEAQPAAAAAAAADAVAVNPAAAGAAPLVVREPVPDVTAATARTPNSAQAPPHSSHDATIYDF